MGMRRWSLHFALVLPFFLLGFGLEVKEEQVPEGPIDPATIEIDENLVGLLLAECGLEWIYLKPFYDTSDLSLVVTSGSTGAQNNGNDILKKKHVQKFLNNLPPDAQKKLFDCLSRKGLIALLSKYDASSSGWFLKRPQPTQSRRYLATAEQSGGDSGTTIIVAVVITAVVTFFLAFLVFLCFFKTNDSKDDDDKSLRISSPGDPGDSEKLYSTGLSIKDFDVPPFDTNKISSKKSYATGLSIKNFKASRKSYATELSSKNFEDPPPCDTNKISSKKSYACGLSIKNFRASRKSYATELSNKNFEASRKSYATGLSNKNFEASRKSDATGLSINNVEDGNAPIPPLKPPPGRVASSLKGDLPSSKPLGRVRSFLPEPPAFLSKFLSPAAPPPEPPQPPSSEPSGAPAPPPPPPSTAPAAPPPPPAPGGKPGVAPPPPPPRGGVPPPPRPGVPPPPRPGGGPPRPPTTNAADASKAKLKPFFWDKVVTNPEHQMVWHQIKAGSFEYNEEMIESLFGCVPTDKNKKDEKKPPKDPPARLVQLIDAKKAQNLSILLRALNVTTEEVRDALEHGNELCPELLETLLKMSPTQEEELKLRLYTGDLSQIGPAERFLKALVDIPFFYKRLEALHFMGTLQEEATNVRDSFAVLEAACDELRNSRLFLKLLEAVLKTGNRMNSGTFRGGAQAFKLDTLLKLSDVKGTDGKTTLLHFVVLEIIRSEGIRAARTIKESGSFSSVKSDELDVDVKAIDSEEQLRNLGLQVVSSLGGQLENVKKAASLDADVLTTTASKLGNSLVKTKTFLNTEMKEVEEENGFHQVLKCFVEHAQAEVTQILEEEKKIMGLVKSTGDYFHGTPGKEEGLRLFSVVRDFLVILERACREVAEKFKKESASKAQNKEGQAESAKRPPLKKKCSSKKRSVASSTQQQQKQPIASSIEGSKDPPPQKQQPSSATNGSEKSPQQPPPSSSGKLAESSHRKQTSSMESLDDVCNRLFPIMKEMKMSDNTSSSSDDYSSDENSEPSLRGRSTQSPKQQQASLKDAPTEPSQSYLDFHERLFPKIQDMMSDEDSLSSYDSSSDDDDKSSSIVGSLRSLSQLSSSKDSPAAEPPLKDASIESSPRSSVDVHAVIRGMRIAGGDSCSDEDREEPSSSSKKGSMKSSFALLQEPSTGPGNVNAISGLQQPSISKDGSTKLHDGLPLLTIKEFNTGGDSSTSPASSSDKDNKHSSPREEGSRKSPSQQQDPSSSEESAELSFQQQQQPLSEHVLTEPSYSSPDVDESLHPTIKNMSTSGSTSSSNDGHQPSSNERSSELATQLQPPSPSREGHLKPPLQQQQPSYTSYDSSSDEDNKPSSSREISKDSQQQSSSSSSSGEQPSEPSPELQQPLSADGSLKSPRPSLGVHEEVRPTIKDIRIGGDPSLDEDSKPSPKEGDAESLSQQVSSSRQEHSGTSSQQQHSPPKDGSTDSPCPFSNAREQLFPTTKDVRVDSNSNSSDDSCSNKNLEPSPSSEWSTELSPQHQQPSSLEELEHAKSISPQSSSSSEGLVQTFDTRISGELNPPSSASLYQDHKPSSSGEEYVESISKRDPPFLREEPTEPSSEQQQSFPLDGLTGSLSSSLDVS